MSTKQNIGGLGPLQPYFSEFCRESNIISLDDMTHSGITCQFINWIGRKWLDWRGETNNYRELSDEDHAAFAAWLPGKVDAEIKRIEETPELNCHGDAV